MRRLSWECMGFVEALIWCASDCDCESDGIDDFELGQVAPPICAFIGGCENETISCPMTAVGIHGVSRIKLSCYLELSSLARHRKSNLVMGDESRYK